MTVYATRDADGDRIPQNASIAAFATEAEARVWLLSPFDAREWDHSTAVIAAGDFSDCWIKALNAPTVEDGELIVGTSTCAPFRADDLIVRGPGQHPGGRAWWIEPRPPVLTVARIGERA